MDFWQFVGAVIVAMLIIGMLSGGGSSGPPRLHSRSGVPPPRVTHVPDDDKEGSAE